jgi:Na+/melibiose symporter-like transporter
VRLGKTKVLAVGVLGKMGVVDEVLAAEVVDWVLAAEVVDEDAMDTGQDRKE